MDIQTLRAVYGRTRDTTTPAQSAEEREEELPELPLLTQWRPAFRLALAWYQAAGELWRLGEYADSDRYRRHAEDILDTLEAKL